jgi:hypothetical protein
MRSIRVLEWQLDNIHILISIICMHRTTILLPEELKRSAERKAQQEGVSLSELIRRGLSKDVQENAKQPAFFARRPWGGSSPDDLSARHDDYLYGEG